MSSFFPDCPQSMNTLPPISIPTTCYISSTCAQITCCVQVNAITTTFTTSLTLDPCTFRMTVSVEKLTFTRDLYSYDWGQEEMVWLFGVVRMRSV